MQSRRFAGRIPKPQVRQLARRSIFPQMSRPKGAGYLEKACAADPDAVRVASHATWRMRYYARDSKQSPEMDLLVWQSDAYREIKASPPGRRFGVPIDNYAPAASRGR